MEHHTRTPIATTIARLRATCSTVAATTKPNAALDTGHSGHWTLCRACNYQNLSKLTFFSFIFVNFLFFFFVLVFLSDQPGEPRLVWGMQLGHVLDFEMQTRHLILLSPQFNYLFGGKCHVQCQQHCDG